MCYLPGRRAHSTVLKTFASQIAPRTYSWLIYPTPGTRPGDDLSCGSTKAFASHSQIWSSSGTCFSIPDQDQLMRGAKHHLPGSGSYVICHSGSGSRAQRCAAGTKALPFVSLARQFLRFIPHDRLVPRAALLCLKAHA